MVERENTALGADFECHDKELRTKVFMALDKRTTAMYYTSYFQGEQHEHRYQSTRGSSTPCALAE